MIPYWLIHEDIKYDQWKFPTYFNEDNIQDIQANILLSTYLSNAHLLFTVQARIQFREGQSEIRLKGSGAKPQENCIEPPPQTSVERWQRAFWFLLDASQLKLIALFFDTNCNVNFLLESKPPFESYNKSLGCIFANSSSQMTSGLESRNERV